MKRTVMLEKDVKVTYNFIVKYIMEHGYAPSQKEIASNTTSNTYTVQQHLRTLEAAGYITKTKRKPRALKLNRYKIVEK